LSSSVHNSEGGGDGDGGDSCADPLQEFNHDTANNSRLSLFQLAAGCRLELHEREMVRGPDHLQPEVQDHPGQRIHSLLVLAMDYVTPLAAS